MAWIKWGLLFSFGVLLSPVCVSAEQQQQQGHSGFRRLYVVQPGPGPGSVRADGGVRVSSISTRSGAAGQPHTYNVELTANFGGQVRTRRMGNQAAPVPVYSQQQQQQQQVVRQSGAEQSQQKQLLKLSGVNVCGGQCCHGWSKAQGSQRCTKPNCIPQCQNGGMCLRPQLCVCKPGSKGKACEQKTVSTHPFPAPPGNEPTNGHNTGYTNGHNVVPQRPIPQQVSPHAPPPATNMAQMKLTVKPPPSTFDRITSSSTSSSMMDHVRGRYLKKKKKRRLQSDEERFAITVARPINHRGQDNAVVIAKTVVQLSLTWPKHPQTNGRGLSARFEERGSSYHHHSDQPELGVLAPHLVL
ncbi:hypothetical protein INR49_023110, partial [Caranx melampygus]